MTKIKNTQAYPIKKYPIATDFFVGSDSEDSGKTVNFEIQTIVNMASGLMDYVYSKSSLPLTSPEGDGYFLTDGITDFSLITTMSVSKITLAGQNLTPYLNFLKVNTPEFTLKIIDKTDQNIFAYYAINTITEHPDYFVFNVVLAPGNNYLGELIDKDIFTFVYEKIPGAGSDLITQTITDGDTTHAPSGDAVFDALALKTNKNITLNINGVSQDLSANRQWRAGLSNTGALTYNGISVVSPTTVNVGLVTGIITDNENTPGTPNYILVNYAGATNIPIPTISGGTGTYVLLDKGIITGGIGAGALVFQNTFPTSAQRKSMIYLSKISHPNLLSISFAIDEPDFVTSPLQQFRDLFQVIQYMNQGIIASGNAGLTINTTNGVVLGDGINFVVDRTTPNMITIPAGAPRNFLLLNQSGAVGSFVTAIDPVNYDVAGVTTPVGGGVQRSTIQYLYYAPGVGFAIQRGQTIYPSLLDAVTAVGREAFVVRPNLVNNSILIAAICIRHTATAMNDINFVRILPADKFGQLGGASSGISVTSLQTAYNNSLVPQISVTDLLGAFTIRSARASNASTIQEWQNIAGLTTGSVNGNGLFTSGSTTLNDNAPTANNHLVRKDYVDLLLPTISSKLNENYVDNNYVAQNPPSSLSSVLYEAFPLMVRGHSNKMFLFYRQGADHATSKGVIQMRTSTDGGGTWTSASTIISDASLDCRNVSGGITPSGRIVLFFMKYIFGSALSSSQGYIYSDNEGATWSTYTTIPNGIHTFYSPYGNLISIGDGKIMANWYGETPGTPTYNSYIITSTDDGATWSSAVPVATSTSIRYGEASYAYLDGGQIVGIIRNSVGSVLYQVNSNDNGVNWTNNGVTSFDTGSHVSPYLRTYIDPNNQKYVACFYANRTDNKLKVVVGDYAGLIAGVSGWISATRTDLTTHTSTDFGYPTVLKSRENNKFLIALYKASSSSLASINLLNFTPKNIDISSYGNITTSTTSSAKDAIATNSIQIKGDITIFPTVGNGLEMFNQLSNTIIQSYDRVGAVYNQLNYRGSLQTWNIGISEKMRLHASGGVSIGNTTDPTANNLFVQGNIGLGIAPSSSRVHIAASTTTLSAIRLTVGVAPTTPNDGDIWLESNTNTGLKIRIAGVTKTISLV